MSTDEIIRIAAQCQIKNLAVDKVREGAGILTI